MVLTGRRSFESSDLQANDWSSKDTVCETECTRWEGVVSRDRGRVPVLEFVGLAELDFAGLALSVDDHCVVKSKPFDSANSSRKCQPSPDLKVWTVPKMEYTSDQVMVFLLVMTEALATMLNVPPTATAKQSLKPASLRVLRIPGAMGIESGGDSTFLE